MACLLYRRGLDPPDFHRFLHPSISDLSPWNAVPGMERAVEAVLEAARQSRRVLVWGDYDADGLTAAACAALAVRAAGGDAVVHVPHRLSDGYGLGSSAAGVCIAVKAGMLLTVDCGISACDEIAALEACGVETVVTDHHDPAGPVPPASVIVDPKLHGVQEPWSDLSGSGLALKLALGLAEASGSEEEIAPAALALASVGTICDVVPLKGDNRVIARCGLEALANGAVRGLTALASAAGLTPGPLSASDVAFRIGPRLNAAGRVGDPLDAVRLLTSSDPEEIRAICGRMDVLNARRRDLDRMVSEEAAALAAADPDAPIVFLASRRWHRGVVGIAASRLAGDLGKPVILSAVDDDGFARGSARSVPGLAINELLARVSDLLVEFGGHASAAGLGFTMSNFDDIALRLRIEVEKLLPGGPPGPVLFLDGRLESDEIGIGTADDISLLEPFGEGNEEPVWITGPVVPLEWRTTAGGKHAQAVLQAGSCRLRAIGFGLGDRRPPEGPIEIAYCLRSEEWRGVRSLRIHLRDFRTSRAGS